MSLVTIKLGYLWLGAVLLQAYDALVSLLARFTKLLSFEWANYLTSERHILQPWFILNLWHLHSIETPEHDNQRQRWQPNTQQEWVNPPITQQATRDYPPVKCVWVAVIPTVDSLLHEERFGSINWHQWHCCDICNYEMYVWQIPYALWSSWEAKHHHNATVPRSYNPKVNSLNHKVSAHVDVTSECRILNWINHTTYS